MNTVFLTLIRREFWENRVLWLGPLAAAVLVLAGMTFGSFGLPRLEGWLPPPDLQAAVIRMFTLMGVTAFLGGIAGIAVFAYLLDCLFGERRDRSILFWKSLPVSDAQSVLAKLTVAMVLVPLGVTLLALVLLPLTTLIAWLRFEEIRPLIVEGTLGALPETMARIGLLWAFALLWFAPVASYLMLASVLAKRAPLVYALMPPLVLILGEQLMLDSRGVRRFFVDRLFPWPGRLEQLLAKPFDLNSEVWIPFQSPGLWIGLAVAAGMLYIVIRLRRYRDDT